MPASSPSDKPHPSPSRQLSSPSKSSQPIEGKPLETQQRNSDREAGSGDVGGEEEFEIESILGHRKFRGKLQYYVKWKGYPDEDNSWVRAEDLLAPELLLEYQKSVNGADKISMDSVRQRKDEDVLNGASPTNRRHSVSEYEESPVSSTGKEVNISDSRKSPPLKKAKLSADAKINQQHQQSPPSPTSTLTEKGTRSRNISAENTQKVENDQMAPNGNRVKGKKKEFAREPANLSDDSDAVEVYNPPKHWDWDEKVDHVDTIEQLDDGSFVVHLIWKNGRQSTHPRPECNVRCPQKMIAFYEAHLRFKPSN
ncbi:hypothetical protein BKA69DRAFT_1072167 [Paraphysoderma sedebokerense]|nr:hypothetical protein BKA69DRAFT_1072107 [Paraphysoderma sedebokerense]KAI9141705.1 hypothetical protein BKA69DRAFT_1072167 [Paraphysoderma sedebokerense]